MTPSWIRRKLQTAPAPPVLAGAIIEIVAPRGFFEHIATCGRPKLGWLLRSIPAGQVEPCTLRVIGPNGQRFYFNYTPDRRG
jgi:hypothetical protein